MFAEDGKYYRIKHLIPIVPVYFIISTVTISFTFYYALEPSDGYIKYLSVPIFYFFALMTFVCHLFAMFTNPGQLDKSRECNVNVQIQNDHLYCNKCQNSRSERTHHCKVCNKCIFKMDHHCPWIANCVGLNNQKFFYQFLFYSTFGDLIAFLCLMSKIDKINIDTKISGQNFSNVGEIFYAIREPFIILLGIILSLAMTIAIGFLFVMQTRCIIYNFTSIEDKIYKNSNDNPWFTTNNKMKNMKMVLGESFFNWFFPCGTIQEGYNHKPLSKLTSQKDYVSLTDNIPEYEDNGDNIHIDLNLND